MRPHTYLYLLLLVCNSLLAQKTNSDYHSRWHSADDNTLPQNSVKSIIKDSSGYIWLATENGIVRYNGQFFKTFNSDNIDGIKSNRMRHFYGNPSLDTIFIKNDVGQYFTIIERKLRFVTESKVALKFKSSYSKTIKNNSILEDQKFYLNHQQYYKISQDSIALINKKNRKSFQVSRFLDNTNTVFNVDGNLFITEKGNEYFSLLGNRFYSHSFDFDFKIDAIFTNELMQQTLIQSGENLYLLELKNNKLIPKLVYSDFNKKDNIVCFFYDKITATLFLGSTSKGLQIIKKKDFKSIEGKNKNGVYYALLAEKNSEILATSGEIFGKENDTNINLTPINDGYILKRDRNGNLWTKAYNVLICHTKESSFKKSIKWNFKHRITEIVESKDGRIIVATSIENLSKGKIYSLNPSEIKNSFRSEMNVNFSTTFLHEEENNKFWAGTSTGLHHINLSTKKTSKIGPEKQTYIRNIYSNNPAEIWLASYDSGIYLYQTATKKLTHFPPDKDNFLLTAHCIVEDKKGFFWITTNKGLFQVSKKNLLLYASGKSENVYYQYYDKKSGFNTNEFNGGCNSCGITLENNEFAFPSIEGIVHFNPENIRPLLPINDIYFNEVEVDGKNASLADNCIHLNYDFERVVFTISSPYYGNPKNLNIDIHLDGPQSQNWIPLDEQTITFSSLPPGEYFLTARKLNGFDSDFQYRKIKIVILPPFWKTFWFNLLMILSTVAIVYFIVRIRVKYIKRKNRILEIQIAEKTSQLRKTIKSLKKTETRLSHEIINHKKLLSQITHDIKSPLRFMAMTGKHLHQNLDNHQEVKDGVESIYSSSSQLYNFVDNLLEYAKINDKETVIKFNVYDLIDEKIILFQNLAKSHDTKIINSIDKKEVAIGNKMLLSIIFHNLLDNAVKNTFEGEIRFTSGKIDGKTFIVIEDNGKGMSKEKVDYYNKISNIDPNKNKEKKGMGLKIIRELLQLKRAKMIVESAKNEGTKITIILSSDQVEQ